ncbi:MAG: ATP phosphoribosyltransferase, partial [Planctomycetota bacterium]|nr:ATP phosphoribosyltransferase [Planctomycetota bacterium]
SLRANRLRIVETICESVTVIIANRRSWQDSWKRQKIEALALMLQGALAAADKVLLKMNVSQANLAAVLAKLPALHSPTVNHLAESGWAAVETIVDEEATRSLIPALRAAGAEGIIELPLNKVIP